MGREAAGAALRRGTRNVGWWGGPAQLLWAGRAARGLDGARRGWATWMGEGGAIGGVLGGG